MVKKPIKKFQFGLIRATIWENQGDKGKPWYNVVVTRSYKDGNEFKDSNSFGYLDLPIASKAMDFACLWIAKRQETDQS